MSLCGRARKLSHTSRTSGPLILSAALPSLGTDSAALDRTEQCSAVRHGMAWHSAAVMNDVAAVCVPLRTSPFYSPIYFHS